MMDKQKGIGRMEKSIRERVLEAICEVNDEIMENQDKDLLLNDIIDSFDIVAMMVELEDAFEIEIEAKDVTPDNFRTVDSIVEVVERVLQG